MAGLRSPASPLRDRLLSNSPDPVKSSILRESGMGWHSPPSAPASKEQKANSLISPLRIAKRDSPSPLRTQPSVARRSSSSYKHVRNNHLVSKSPFKSQIPTPATATPTSSRVPTAFPLQSRRVSGEKRPRPMSMHEQAEAENERPFALKRERRQSKTFQGLIEKEPVTKSPFRRQGATTPPPPPLPASTSYLSPDSRIPAPASIAVSPGRSSLVSRRLHGPRLSGTGKRERRKTVTFNEQMDVIEIDCEGELSDEALEDEDDDEDVEMDGDDPFFEPEHQGPEPDDSFDSVELSEDADNHHLVFDPDASITGIVDQMFFASTPPRESYTDIATDLQTDEGLPFDQSPPRQRSSTPETHVQSFAVFSTHSSPHSAATPTRRAPLPAPPTGYDNGLASVKEEEIVASRSEDVYTHPPLRDEPLPTDNSYIDDSIAVSQFSVEHSTVCSDDVLTPNLNRNFQKPASRPQTPETDRPHIQPDRQLPIPPSSPSFNQASPTGSPGGPRPRINREDVHRRLLRQRSFGSPIPEAKPSGDGPSSPQADEQSFNQVETELDDSHMDENQSSMVVHEEVEGEEEEEEEEEFGLLKAPQPGGKLGLDFGSKFGLGGLGLGDVAASQSSVIASSGLKHESPYQVPGTRMELGQVDVDMDMKSALDRLMDDVAGGKLEEADLSMATDEGYSFDQPSQQVLEPKLMQRAATDSIIVGGVGPGIMSRTVSGASTISIPPPLPPKDNIRSREALILEKRRELRKFEEDESDNFFNGPHLTVGRPSRRRSMSTGDVEGLKGTPLRNAGSLMDIVPSEPAADPPLTDIIEQELKKKLEKPSRTGYYIREREGTIFASSSGEISHMAGPGDVNAGRAWRTVRRPSDMNEYSKQIKEYREQEKGGKAYGKVFVKVLGVKDIHVPMPSHPTTMTCTLNNGIHFVTTPDCRFSKDGSIEQEFELIEHSKLEFTLTLKIRRDPHIISEFKALAPAAPVPPPLVAQTSSKSSGMRGFFSSSPKKPKEKLVKQPTPPQPIQRLPENLARYLKPDGTLARAFISFNDIAHRCDTRLFETTFPLIGQRSELGNKSSAMQVGEIVLQVFRLPPLPGIAPDQLPQSLEECHRGLRHINWHKVTYFEGTLTQSGGDCNSWRRRQLRIIGSNLVAFNDVTKRATATISLKKALAVEDGQESRNNAVSPSSQMTSRSSRFDEGDSLYGVERSFRLVFPEDEILFFADTDEEKTRWLEVLRALVGHIPPHPLWAELLWQRQEEALKRTQSPATQPPSQLRKPVPSA
ncbi:hypothetical protein C8J56DRAFT_444291 [Mycena floridula]|nr:hypothetical protein C8J56DRAFT_444291 [Mycena floridula]